VGIILYQSESISFGIKSGACKRDLASNKRGLKTSALTSGRWVSIELNII